MIEFSKEDIISFCKEHNYSATQYIDYARSINICPDGLITFVLAIRDDIERERADMSEYVKGINDTIKRVLIELDHEIKLITENIHIFPENILMIRSLNNFKLLLIELFQCEITESKP